MKMHFTFAKIDLQISVLLYKTNKVDFDDEENKNILCVEGGAEIQDLFKHESKVLDTDTYDEAIQKVRAALKGRENRSAAVYRLFTALPQGKQTVVK